MQTTTDRQKPTGEKRAVATLVLGDEARRLFEIGEPFLKFYAGKTHADLVVLKTAALQTKTSYMEKFQLGKLLETYDRVLFLDVDILVQPRTPDIFALVPKTHFGAVYDNPENSPAETSNRALELKRARKALGDIGWRQGYFNSGVMVFSSMHRKIFDHPEEADQIDTIYPDQTLLNYNIHRYNIPVFRLDTRYNAMGINGFWSFPINPGRPLAHGNNKFEAFFMHFANEGDKVVQMGDCAKQLHETLKAFESGGTPEPFELYTFAQCNRDNPDAKRTRLRSRADAKQLMKKSFTQAERVVVVFFASLLSKGLHGLRGNRLSAGPFANVEISIPGWTARESLHRLGVFPAGYALVSRKIQEIKPGRVVQIGVENKWLSELLTAGDAKHVQMKHEKRMASDLKPEPSGGGGEMHLVLTAPA